MIVNMQRKRIGKPPVSFPHRDKPCYDGTASRSWTPTEHFRNHRFFPPHLSSESFRMTGRIYGIDLGNARAIRPIKTQPLYPQIHADEPGAAKPQPTSRFLKKAPSWDRQSPDWRGCGSGHPDDFAGFRELRLTPLGCASPGAGFQPLKGLGSVRPRATLRFALGCHGPPCQGWDRIGIAARIACTRPQNLRKQQRYCDVVIRIGWQFFGYLRGSAPSADDKFHASCVPEKTARENRKPCFLSAGVL